LEYIAFDPVIIDSVYASQSKSFMPRPLTEKEFESEAKQILISICGTDHPDPYREPFTPLMAWRRIINPYIYLPDFHLLSLLSKKTNGEQGFYLTVYDRPPEEERRQPYHWYVSFREIKKIKTFRKAIGFCAAIPSVIYSPAGSWGIVASDDHVGVFGATQRLGTQLNYYLPDPSIDALNFIDLVMWFREHAMTNKRNVDFSWVPNLLVHIYGASLANELLRKAKW
jgi:hypothetical protein